MDDWCWERIINPVKKCVFSLRWQMSAENNITAEDSEESLCGAAEPRGALPVHKGLGRVTQPVVLWMHYHQSTVNISFTGSLTLFKLKKKKKSSEKRAEEQQIPTVLTRNRASACEAWNMLWCLWKCASVTSRLLRRCLPTHGHNVTLCYREAAPHSPNRPRRGQQTQDFRWKTTISLTLNTKLMLYHRMFWEVRVWLLL